jgi:hypothetical protein
VAPHRRVVSDPNSVPGDSGPGAGRDLRPARLPGRQDLRARLKRVGGSTLGRRRGKQSASRSDSRVTLQNRSGIHPHCVRHHVPRRLGHRRHERHRDGGITIGILGCELSWLPRLPWLLRLPLRERGRRKCGRDATNSLNFVMVSLLNRPPHHGERRDFAASHSRRNAASPSR